MLISTVLFTVLRRGIVHVSLTDVHATCPTGHGLELGTTGDPCHDGYLEVRATTATNRVPLSCMLPVPATQVVNVTQPALYASHHGRSACQRPSVTQVCRHVVKSPKIVRLATDFVNRRLNGTKFVAVQIRPYPDECRSLPSISLRCGQSRWVHGRSGVCHLAT